MMSPKQKKPFTSAAKAAIAAILAILSTSNQTGLHLTELDTWILIGSIALFTFIGKLLDRLNSK